MISTPRSSPPDPSTIVGPHAANHIPVPAVDKGHGRALTAFAEAVVAGKPFNPGAVDDARATVCALKAYDSIRANQPIAILPSDYGAQ